MDKLTGLLDGYRQKKTKNNDDTPLVNIDALNRILVESEDEEESKIVLRAYFKANYLKLFNSDH